MELHMGIQMYGSGDLWKGEGNGDKVGSAGGVNYISNVSNVWFLKMVAYTGIVSIFFCTHEIFS